MRKGWIWVVAVAVSLLLGCAAPKQPVVFGPPVVVLTAPVDLAVDIELNHIFRWTASPGQPQNAQNRGAPVLTEITIYWQTLGDTDWQSKALDAGARSVSLEDHLTARTTYRWKVVAQQDQGAQKKSDSTAFSTFITKETASDPEETALWQAYLQMQDYFFTASQVKEEDLEDRLTRSVEDILYFLPQQARPFDLWFANTSDQTIQWWFLVQIVDQHKNVIAQSWESPARRTIPAGDTKKVVEGVDFAGWDIAKSPYTIKVLVKFTEDEAYRDFASFQAHVNPIEVQNWVILTTPVQMRSSLSDPVVPGYAQVYKTHATLQDAAAAAVTGADKAKTPPEITFHGEVVETAQSLGQRSTGTATLDKPLLLGMDGHAYDGNMLFDAKGIQVTGIVDITGDATITETGSATLTANSTFTGTMYINGPVDFMNLKFIGDLILGPDAVVNFAFVPPLQPPNHKFILGNFIFHPNAKFKGIEAENVTGDFEADTQEEDPEITIVFSQDDLIQALLAGKTYIRLGRDLQLQHLPPLTYKLTLDLFGHRLTGDLDIRADGTLIKGSEVKGKITIKSPPSYTLAPRTTGVVLEGLTYLDGASIVVEGKAKATIQGATIAEEAQVTFDVWKDGEMTLSKDVELEDAAELVFQGEGLVMGNTTRAIKGGEDSVAIISGGIFHRLVFETDTQLGMDSAIVGSPGFSARDSEFVTPASVSLGQVDFHNIVVEGYTRLTLLNQQIVTFHEDMDLNGNPLDFFTQIDFGALNQIERSILSNRPSGTIRGAPGKTVHVLDSLGYEAREPSLAFLGGVYISAGVGVRNLDFHTPVLASSFDVFSIKIDDVSPRFVSTLNPIFIEEGVRFFADFLGIYASIHLMSDLFLGPNVDFFLMGQSIVQSPEIPGMSKKPIRAIGGMKSARVVVPYYLDSNGIIDPQIPFGNSSKRTHFRGEGESYLRLPGVTFKDLDIRVPMWVESNEVGKLGLEVWIYRLLGIDITESDPNAPRSDVAQEIGMVFEGKVSTVEVFVIGATENESAPRNGTQNLPIPFTLKKDAIWTLHDNVEAEGGLAPHTQQRASIDLFFTVLGYSGSKIQGNDNLIHLDGMDMIVAGPITLESLEITSKGNEKNDPRGFNERKGGPTQEVHIRTSVDILDMLDDLRVSIPITSQRTAAVEKVVFKDLSWDVNTAVRVHPGSTLSLRGTIDYPGAGNLLVGGELDLPALSSSRETWTTTPKVEVEKAPGSPIFGHHGHEAPYPQDLIINITVTGFTVLGGGPPPKDTPAEGGAPVVLEVGAGLFTVDADDPAKWHLIKQDKEPAFVKRDSSNRKIEMAVGNIDEDTGTGPGLVCDGFIVFFTAGLHAGTPVTLDFTLAGVKAERHTFYLDSIHN